MRLSSHLKRLMAAVPLLSIALACGGGEETGPAPAPHSTEASSDRVTVIVSEHGYSPASITATAGKPLTLVFKRTSDGGCGQEVVFPERDIRRPLPVGKEVVVELTPGADERIAFTCGMGMYQGSIVASHRDG